MDKIKLKKKSSAFTDAYTSINAIKNGNLITKLSILVMGLGNISKKQIIKGFLFLLVEIIYITYMIKKGFYSLIMLFTLGDKVQEEVWNEAKGIYEYTAGDNSLLLLLYGIVTLFITALFILVWRTSIKSAYKAECLSKSGGHLNSINEDIKSLFNQNLHKLLLTFPILGLVAFTILPIVYMICMAFTTYSTIDDQLVLFNWSGLTNFIKVLNIKDSVGQTFWSVLQWTLTWAVFATGLNYILGMLLAIMINRKTTRAKSFWRFCFVLTIAIPQFVSLLIMKTILQPKGMINILLENAGLINNALPFFTNATWARVTVIVVNLWVGIPFTLMQVTGILQNIPEELYDAAKVDGANGVTVFFKITLPYMLFVTTPYLITTFTQNINNFNVIYLLSTGAPVPVGSSAGKTDLLVTWLYKLTIDQRYYNLGAVIGIMTFVVLGIFSLITYRNTGSYKNEEGFQ